MKHEEFIGSREAARRLGMSPLTLRRRVRRGDLNVFADPRDDRRRLLRVTDLEELERPRPVGREQVTEVSAA